MGCSLNKLEKREEKRPGNIYSTLKRPQVETKVDVTYEYCFLEFTTLTAGEYKVLGGCLGGTQCRMGPIPQSKREDSLES
jgi:hypothetical protein